VDTIANTLELPPHRRERLFATLEATPPTQKRVSLKKWHSILGELRSMTIALPGSRGLFSHLQAALRSVQKGRIHVTRHVHATLDDFCWPATNLDSRPTRLPELVATSPAILGTTDASGLGMGGVLLEPAVNLRQRATLQSGHPMLWRQPFPEDVVNDLVTHGNPHGETANSDLESAPTVVQHDVICQHYDVRETTAHNSTDNTPALSWQRRGSISANTTPACLLRLQALHQRFHRCMPLHSCLPGILNSMADDASRLWH